MKPLGVIAVLTPFGTWPIYGSPSLARHVGLCDYFESPCQPPPQSLGVGPEGADRRVGNLACLQLTDRRAVDPRPFGHIREAQSLSLAFAAQARQGRDQFRISDRRVFLSIGFNVSGQFVLILGSLALGSTPSTAARCSGVSSAALSRRRCPSEFAGVWLRMNYSSISWAETGRTTRVPASLWRSYDHNNRLARGRLANQCRTP